jgi:uncharacterized protein YciI
MNKNYFALRIIPSRPDFAQTMTQEEKDIMQQHALYWTDHMNKGMVHVFGPVLDPQGIYGLGVISADDEKQVQEFIQNDPASRINKIEFHPMMAVVAGK